MDAFINHLNEAAVEITLLQKSDDDYFFKHLKNNLIDVVRIISEMEIKKKLKIINMMDQYLKMNLKLNFKKNKNKNIDRNKNSIFEDEVGSMLPKY